jgi:predicted nucleic acid-binding protein
VRLLDTDICIDLQRQFRPALEWLAGLSEAPGLPGFVLLELMRGSRNAQEMRQLRQDTAAFRVFWPVPADCDRAVETYTRARLSSGLSILDLMIGESAVGLGATLCTFDTQMRAISNLVTEQPYARP